MTTDDLRSKYNKPVAKYLWQMDDDYFTDDYVLWLEEQLLNQLTK